MQIVSTRRSFLGSSLALALIGPRAALAGAGFEAIEPMRTPRSGHVAVLLHDGTVLLAGGMARNQVFHSSCERYDPKSKAFHPAASLHAARVSLTATSIADGRILLAGGYEVGRPSAAVDLYDPASDTMTTLRPMLDARGNHCAALLTDGSLLLAGGLGVDGTLASAERYDPKSGRSQRLAMKSGRWAFTMTRLHDRTLLLAGGGNGSHNVSSSAELFDEREERFIALPAMANVRYKHGATLLSDGRVLLVGGADERDAAGLIKPLEYYDPTARKFVATSLETSRYKNLNGVATLRDGTVLFAAGSATAEIFDSRTQRLRAVGSVGTHRYFSTATTLGDGAVLIAGGYDHGGGEASASCLFFHPA